MCDKKMQEDILNERFNKHFERMRLEVSDDKTAYEAAIRFIKAIADTHPDIYDRVDREVVDEFLCSKCITLQMIHPNRRINHFMRCRSGVNCALCEDRKENSKNPTADCLTCGWLNQRNGPYYIDTPVYEEEN